MTSDSAGAAPAARDLAAVLLAHADDLDSNDLATVSAAMTAVRRAARQLEAALTARGWGNDVLYGFGQPLDTGSHEPDEDDELLADLLEEVAAEDEQEWVVPAGTRLSIQSRCDVVVVDEGAFLDYVEHRAAQAGAGLSREDIVEHSPGFVLAYLLSLAEQDLDGSGLVFAGAQEVVGEVARTLWEMDDDDRDDQFPMLSL